MENINYSEENKEVTFTSCEYSCGQKIRNSLSFEAIKRARAEVLFAVERFENIKAPEKMDSELLEIFYQMEECLKKWIISNIAYEIAKKVDEEAIKNVSNL